MFPIATSIAPRRTPYANYFLIAINVVLFIASMQLVRNPMGQGVSIQLRAWTQMFLLHPQHPKLWQFVSYGFLHSGLMHIIGNMYFLYIFGNNVNDKLGHVSYICFYLAGAVFAGLGHSLLHINPVLGASGAVAAVTGAYLVLFPQTVITVLYIFIFIGTFELKALYFILFKLIFWDNIFEPRFSNLAVAYDAHLAGYFFGVFAILLMLAIKIIDSDRQDLWSMIKQWNRRRQYRDVVTGGYDPYNPTHRVKKSVKSRVSKEPAVDELTEDTMVLEIRANISEHLRRHDLATAARLYEDLVILDSRQVLARQDQLDVANQLMSTGQWIKAARAYEKFLAHYVTGQHTEQVHLMLGLLYGRYLDEKDKAIDQLTKAREKLSDPNQLKMCTDELTRLKGIG